MKTLLRVMGFVLALALGGCSLPEHVAKRAQTAKIDAERVRQTYASELGRFTAWSSSLEGARFASTFAREDWKKKYFETADQNLKAAEQRVKDEVTPLLSANRKSDQVKLEAAAIGVDLKVKAAQKALANYQSRKKALEGVAANLPKLLVEAEATTTEIDGYVKGFDTAVKAAVGEFQERAEDIRGLTPQLTSTRDTAKKLLMLAKEESAQASPDYGHIIDALAGITNAHATAKKYVGEQTNRLGELRESYSKTLVDMRVDYYATVSRITWDEDSDWDTEQNHTYQPVKVTQEVHNLLSDPQWDNNPIAEGRRGIYAVLGGMKLSVKDTAWNGLGLDPWQSAPFGDDHAQYYADTSEKYFHKYQIVKNGVVQNTDWIEVNEKTFDSLEEFQGMDVESKPFGAFASEILTVPAPMGMAYVGNPAYGTWKQDTSGNRFWEFYGRYALMRDLMGGHTYSHSEWENWRSEYRGKKPYLGKDDRYGTGGTFTQSHPTLSQTHYAKTTRARPSANAGGASVSTATRGKGAAFRGGGPGGAGK